MSGIDEPAFLATAWPVLEGTNLVVRPFLSTDIRSAYVGWLNDPDVVRYSNQRFRNHSLTTCHDYLDSFVDTPNLFLAVIERFSGRMVGTVTAYRNLQHRTADIGIMVGDRRVWGKGYGLEAFSLVMDSLFAIGEVRKVTAGTISPNIGMIRIMERSGMHLEATRVAQELVDGVPVDILYYARFHGN